MKVALEKDIKMMDELGYKPDEQKLKETIWVKPIYSEKRNIR